MRSRAGTAEPPCERPACRMLPPVKAGSVCLRLAPLVA